MLIEILTEDKSGAVIVRRLAEQICSGAGCDARIVVRPHRGCGNIPKLPDEKPPRFASALLDLLPASCRAYNRVYKNTDMILVVVMDSDDNDPDELRKKLYAITRKYAPGIRSVIGLCTEEVEAWLLGDTRAVLDAYPDANPDAFDNYIQDSVCGTWEHLCEIVCPDNYEDVLEIGYPAIGQYKAKWAERISGYMEADRNISPSFINFKNSLLVALRGNAADVNRSNGHHHTRSF